MKFNKSTVRALEHGCSALMPRVYSIDGFYGTTCIRDMYLIRLQICLGMSKSVEYDVIVDI
jgi:hypothetical protein